MENLTSNLWGKWNVISPDFTNLDVSCYGLLSALHFSGKAGRDFFNMSALVLS